MPILIKQHTAVKGGGNHVLLGIWMYTYIYTHKNLPITIFLRSKYNTEYTLIYLELNITLIPGGSTQTWQMF